MVRRLQHGGSVHFVIDQPDGTRGLLPAWMTRTEVTRLLKRLMTECVVAGVAQPVEGAADE